jgi:hypothetical protein
MAINGEPGNSVPEAFDFAKPWAGHNVEKYSLAEPIFHAGRRDGAIPIQVVMLPSDPLAAQSHRQSV